MSDLEQRLEELRAHTLAAIAQAHDTAALDEVRVGVLGKKGSLTEVLRGMRDVAADERPKVGKVSNAVRDALESAFEERKEALATVELEHRMRADAVDVTLPGRSHPVGSEHLINGIVREISEIFAGIGYRVMEGPEVETDYLFDDQFNTRNARVYLRNIDAVDFGDMKDIDGYDAAVDRSRQKAGYGPHSGTRILRYFIENGFVEDSTDNDK